MTEQRHAHTGLPEFHLHGPNNDQSKSRVLRLTRNVTIALLLLMAFGMGKTLFSRWSYGDVLAARAAENVKLHVLVTQPTPAAKNSASSKVVLPGTMLGINESQIYARTNGYVKQWFKDIGDVAKKGETLAILDIPEVSKQVEEATANFELAKTVYERWKRLRAEDAVSQQELDEKTGIYKQTEAVLKRLRDQLSFGTVVAPFEGTITRRNINVGDLVNLGNTGSAQAMFSMARTDKLHVYVYMPQDRAGQVRVGEEVDLYEPSSPDKPYKGQIARTAGAIDTNTRTLQVDIEVPNPNGKLMPGAYVEAAVKIDPKNVLLVPTNTLIFGAGGPYVAVVVDGKVEKKKVTLGVDYGMMVEVRSGVTASDELIQNPPDSITPGQVVVIETPPAPPAKRGS
jgi:RND family efflux transporter MFP subunit